jgi:ubiquinone/menaquinone biosynthesis C-methylase UbiE
MLSTSRVKRDCPLCEQNQAQTIIRPFQIQGKAMPVVACTSCGMVYADLPKLVSVSHNEEYATGALHSYLQLATSSQYWAYRHTLKLLGPPRPNQRLLDYGAGIGSLMIIAHELGWEAYGVDPSPYAAWTRDQLGLKMFVGFLDSSPYPDAFFDAVTTLSTLEHIYDLKQELHIIHRKLREKGILIISGVPNFDSWENHAARHLTKNWEEVFTDNAPPNHINFLTPQTIKKLITQVGFSKVKVGTYGLKLVSGSEFKSHTKQSLSPNNKLSIPSHPFLSPAFVQEKKKLLHRVAVEAYMSFRIPWGGDKLFVIAQK